MEVQSYRDLLVWQKAMDLVVVCYRLAEKLPASEAYGLATDIKRQARLVPSYIADGKGRKQLSEYIAKLSPAHGSLMALETDLLLVERLSLLPMSEIEPALDLSSQVGKMLNKLISTLRGKGTEA
ncbi:MAG: four helix bundle protein [Blastocatellales bacterium]